MIARTLAPWALLAGAVLGLGGVILAMNADQRADRLARELAVCHANIAVEEGVDDALEALDGLADDDVDQWLRDRGSREQERP